MSLCSDSEFQASNVIQMVNTRCKIQNTQNRFNTWYINGGCLIKVTGFLKIHNGLSREGEKIGDSQ